MGRPLREIGTRSPPTDARLTNPPRAPRAALKEIGFICGSSQNSNIGSTVRLVHFVHSRYLLVRGQCSFTIHATAPRMTLAKLICVSLFAIFVGTLHAETPQEEIARQVPQALKILDGYA